MNQLKPPEIGYQSRARARVRRLSRWHGAWAAATVLMGFGPIFWQGALGLTLLAVGLDVAVGVGMVLATKKYVMEVDELERKVFLNALGIAMGLGLVSGIPYSLMRAYHIIPFKGALGAVIMIVLMGLTFIVSCLYGAWRYR